MSEMLETLKNWEYVNELKKEWHSFLLNIELSAHEKEIEIFSYKNLDLKKIVKIVYNIDTKDFFLRRKFGLNEYVDINFITPKLDVFEELLKTSLSNVLEEMEKFSKERAKWVHKKKGLLEWEYAEKLPKSILGFDLYIKPNEPTPIISGAAIIIDYSHFSSKSQLIIYYNELRDEFYVERKIKGHIFPLGKLDAANLKELEIFLEEKLVLLVEEIEKKINI